MDRLSIGDFAPDFILPNQDGELIQLSDIYKKHNVVLLFNIGFA